MREDGGKSREKGLFFTQFFFTEILKPPTTFYNIILVNIFAQER